MEAQKRAATANRTAGTGRPDFSAPRGGADAPEAEQRVPFTPLPRTNVKAKAPPLDKPHLRRTTPHTVLPGAEKLAYYVSQHRTLLQRLANTEEALKKAETRAKDANKRADQV